MARRPPPAETSATGPSGAVFVDTNVFLRYLTNDVPEQAAAAEKLFRQASAGTVQLVTNTMVVAELVWVMESYYRLAKPETQQRALAVATMEGLDVPGVDVVVQALLDYVDKNVDYIDAYNAAWARHRAIESIATFDTTHLSRFDHREVVIPGGCP
ncbi:MAG: PIN domain-containing protein [Thermoleophilia bacterium]